MDFKFKSIGWVGGIYQKFETLCHEVDNIVTQDTVKYVENQAQNVGKSMKRFYSDVVDMLPPLKHEGQGVAFKRSPTMDTYVNSEAAIEEDHIDSVSKLSHVEPVAVNQIEKQLDHASNELCVSDQPSTSTSVDTLEGAESDIMSGQVSDILKNTSFDLNIEENATVEKTSEVLELISPLEEESIGASSVNEFIRCNDKDSCGVVGEVSLTMSVHDMEFQSPQKEGIVNNNDAVDMVKKQLDCAFSGLCRVDQLGNPNSMDSLLGAENITSEQAADVWKEIKPEVNIEDNARMEKPSVSEVPDLVSPTEKESFRASLVNEFIDCNDKDSCGVVGEVSLTISVHDMEFQSSQKEGNVNNNIAVDMVKKQLDCAFSELCLVDQLGTCNSEDSLLGAENITSEQAADVSKEIKPEVNIKDNATMEKPSAYELPELISPAEKESFGASLLIEYIDCNDKEHSQVEAEVSPTTSVHDMTKPSGSNVSELISPLEEESFGASLVHEFVNCNDKNLCVVHTDVSPATLVCGGENATTVKKDFADDSERVLDASGGIISSEMTSSATCHEENMAEVGVDSSFGSVLKEYNLPENSPENSPAKALLCDGPFDVAELVSRNLHSSAMLTPLLSSEKKFTGPVSVSSSKDLSMESLETDASRTVNGTESLTGNSGKKIVYFGGESAQFQALSSSDIGPIDDSTDDIAISSMDTIELCDEVKLEDSCVIVDSTALYAASRSMRKHRSYKKRIQDALTSKKRLAKEYEQLAIWFGDADMGPNHDCLQTLRPSSSSTALEHKNPQTQLLCDSEWELL